MIAQTPTGTATHGDQMEETSTPPIRKRSGWFMDPHDRIEGEVWHKYHELAIDQLSKECDNHGSHQALSLAVLSIAAQRAQSHHLAFKFLFIHGSSQRNVCFFCGFLLQVTARSEYEELIIQSCRRSTVRITESSEQKMRIHDLPRQSSRTNLLTCRAEFPSCQVCRIPPASNSGRRS